MDETNFIDKKALKHFEKQLALRDKYVKENGDYIETKRDEIGLSSPEILAELCFALNMENETDDDGDTEQNKGWYPLYATKETMN